MRVLVVEDNQDGRESLQQLLQAWGYEVEALEDGQRGVDKALAWEPDAAIVDIGLPLLDGYEIARRVKAALDDRVRLIAVTGYGQFADCQRAYDAGFDHHLRKPVEPEELRAVLEGPSV